MVDKKELYKEIKSSMAGICKWKAGDKERGKEQNGYKQWNET